MKLIFPKTITDAIILANNLVADTADEYNIASAYDDEDIVKVSFDEDGVTARVPVKKYQAAGEVAAGVYPPDNSDSWTYIGTANEHSMFDEYINTQAVATGSELTDPGKIVLKLNSGRTDSIGLFNLSGTQVTVEILDSSDNVLETYTQTIGTLISSWSEYFFKERSYDEFDTIIYFTKYVKSSIRITIEHSVSGSYPGAGKIIIGASNQIGGTRYGMSPGMVDFSPFTVDAFGRAYSDQGNYAKKLDLSCNVSRADYDRVNKLMIASRGKIIMVDGNNSSTDIEASRVIGRLKRYSFPLERLDGHVLTATIEGII